MLANRLKPLLPNLINENQTAYIRGRFIGQNIRLITDVIDHTEEVQIPGIILFLDFKKAFDSIEHTFLFRALQHFSFGNIFLGWVETIYTHCSSAVTNNGWISEYFPITRGIRLGCPLSAILFLFVMEILALYVKRNKSIKGINLPDRHLTREVKTSQVADDTTLLLGDEKSLILALDTLSFFGKILGPELNLNKTEAIWVGCWKFR